MGGLLLMADFLQHPGLLSRVLQAAGGME